MSAQSVFPRLKFFFPSFSNGNHTDFICADTENCHRDNKLSKNKMVLIDYCENSFSVWVLWKALLIMKLWTDSRHFTGQH